MMLIRTSSWLKGEGDEEAQTAVRNGSAKDYTGGACPPLS